MYNVGILGLGKIASGYGKPGDVNGYTHATGVMCSDNVQLAGAADFSEPARAAFRSLWGPHFPQTQYHDSLAALLAGERIDILAVCIRGPHHFAAVMEALRNPNRPRAIFLEKPASCSLTEMDEMCAAARESAVPITVSYSRHWGPHVLRMAELVRGGLVGEVTDVIGRCGGTFLSYASHTTDMICQFAGYCPSAITAAGDAGAPDVPAGYEPEPRLRSMMIEFANGVIGTQLGRNGDHGAFYCEVVGSSGRALVPFYGSPSAVTAKDEPIDLRPHGIPASISPFTVAYDQIAAHLDGGPPPDCTGDSFVAVNEIGFGAIESIHRHCRIELPNANRRRRVFANG